LTEEGRYLGVVVSGSLTQGLEVKLEGPVSVEELSVGKYVTIEGESRRYFGLITDIKLESLDPYFVRRPPTDASPQVLRALSGTTAYGMIKVLPLLAIDILGTERTLQPARTVPPHFSPVREASQRDVDMVFGSEDERRFYIGNPLDMETKVCLDLEEFVKRSNGIFGKSGSGKTFLTRLILIGILQKNLAANLVFDMHSEYGWEGRSESGYKVKGLKQLFPSRVAIFSLDEGSSLRRGVSTDFIVRIGYQDIEPEDIVLLQETLGLSEAALNACHRLVRHFGERNWLREFLRLGSREEVAGLAREINEHEATLTHLWRRLDNLKRLPFLVPEAPESPVRKILEYLARGVSVVLEFGRYSDYTAYILVANMLTRRIYQQYRELVERSLGLDSPGPIPLFITIEEAHRFLSPGLASQTIFGTIAREMRKYNVTLLVVDQRPGVIDGEIMSQLGTKICCQLDNEKDVEAVLSGVSGKGELRAVLSRLESKQQALFFGHAVPMPVVVRVREYGKSYKEFGIPEPEEMRRKAARDIAELWG